MICDGQTKITLFIHCICMDFLLFLHVFFVCCMYFYTSLTVETFGKSWCFPSFRSSVYISIIVHCFTSERRISFPVVFSVPGFSHQVSSSLRFTDLFLDFARKKSVEFLKIQKANFFPTTSQ